MVLNKRETRDLYRKRARNYDLAVLIYPLFGIRVNRYRQLTAKSLNLKPGDTVVELGCGTGLNFTYLQDQIGESGSIIGVDLTDAMLEVARQRVQDNGWKNVELVQSDMAEYQFPSGIDAALSTLAITLVPEYDQVIQHAAEALKTGRRLAILDLKRPDNWPQWLVRFVAWLNKPFGVSLELAERHPWESNSLYLDQVLFQEFYFGALYLSVCEKKPE